MAFEAEDAELEAKEKAELEKVAKKADDVVRACRINQEVENRTFDNPLASYKRKDDLVALAGALSLPMDGTVAGLTKAIKAHLIDNPARGNEPRFSGLFSATSRKRTAAAANPSAPAVLVPVQSSTPVNSPLVHTSESPTRHALNFPLAGSSGHSVYHTHNP